MREGETGPIVADVQSRLRRAGFDIETSGSVDAGTMAVIREFQRSRRLPADGIVGHETWTALVEAGWSLGDRVLFERHPPWFRGDDVADAQHRLGSLGFNVGKIDGIFGPLARRAVFEFQRNSGLVPDGIIGPKTIRMLSRVSGAPALSPSLAIRERLDMRAHGSGLSGRRIFLDARAGGLDPGNVIAGIVEADFAFELALRLSNELRSAGADTMISRAADSCPRPRERASLANVYDADVVLGLGLCRDEEMPSVDGDIVLTSYFGTERYTSAAGRELSRRIMIELSSLGFVWAAPPQPDSRALLRETRAIAILVEFLPSDRKPIKERADRISHLARACVGGLNAFFAASLTSD